MKQHEYPRKQNQIFCDYDSWAIKQLQNDYDERRSLLMWKAERLADLVPDHIHFTNALEIGAAEGIVIDRLRELLRIETCVAIDISDVFLSHGIKEHLKVTFLRYDGSTFPLRDKSIDVIILSDVIEHISDLQSFFREVQRVGTYVLLKVPLDRYIWRKLVSAPLGRSFHVGPGHPDGHLHEFSRKSLEKLLKTCGMQIITSRVVYHPVSRSENYRMKKGILKTRWYLEYKAKQLFSQCAHKIFGGDFIGLLFIQHD